MKKFRFLLTLEVSEEQRHSVPCPLSDEELLAEFKKSLEWAVTGLQENWDGPPTDMHLDEIELKNIL